ncbi:hypothetical protein [Flagellimonas sp.]|uniref:hypothetical protein n=1 Tax=Flagellimonas sp. TaxID=2058762 RepID=UPI003BA95A9A
MYKVLTVTTHTKIEGSKFTETEYPKLNEYLEDGYSIKETIPIIKPADVSLRYAITFILYKAPNLR